jgi:hypothetical protein
MHTVAMAVFGRPTVVFSVALSTDSSALAEVDCVWTDVDIIAPRGRLVTRITGRGMVYAEVSAAIPTSGRLGGRIQ